MSLKRFLQGVLPDVGMYMAGAVIEVHQLPIHCGLRQDYGPKILVGEKQDTTAGIMLGRVGEDGGRVPRSTNVMAPRFGPSVGVDIRDQNTIGIMRDPGIQAMLVDRSNQRAARQAWHKNLGSITENDLRGLPHDKDTTKIHAPCLPLCHILAEAE